MSAFGWLLYPIPVPAGAFRSTFAVLVLMFDALVVLFTGAFSGLWARWTLMWLALPALVTAVALFEIQRQRGAHSPPPRPLGRSVTLCRCRAATAQYQVCRSPDRAMASRRSWARSATGF